MKRYLVAFCCVFGAAPLAGQTSPPMACVGSAGLPPLVRAEGLSELVGDIVLNCSGGTPTPLGQPVPPVNINIQLNTAVTSRGLPGLPSGHVEALLFIDDPLGEQVGPCLPGLARLLAPCVVNGTGTGIGTYDPRVNPNTRNVFVPSLEGNTLRWFDVPLDPPANGATRTLRFTNIRANPNQLPVAANGTITVILTTSGGTPVTLPGGPITIATAQKSVDFSVASPITLRQCAGANTTLATGTPPAAVEISRFATGTEFALRFHEGFASAFKVRDSRVSAQGATETAHNQAGEERYRAWASFVSGSSSTLGPPTLPIFETRLKALFTSVPADVTLYVEAQPRNWTFVPPVSFTLPGPNFAVPLSVTSGRAEAVWENVGNDPNATETFEPRVWMSFPAGSSTGNLFVHGGLWSETLPGTEVSSILANQFALERSRVPAFNTFQNFRTTQDAYPNAAATVATCATATAFGAFLPPGYTNPLTITPYILPYIEQSPVYNVNFVSSAGAVSNMSITPEATNTPRLATSNWLTVEQNSTTTPATARISVNTTGLAPGSYAGALRISGTGIASGNFPVNLVVRARGPAFSPWGVTNVGSYVNNVVSPGEAIVIFGELFGPATLATASLGTDGKLSTIAGETRVLFDGVAAPMIYAVTGQVSCLTPFGLAGKAVTTIEVEYRGVKSPPIRVPVVAAIPALLTADSSGYGKAAALNQDNSFNSVIGAGAGEYVVLFGVGGPATDPPGRDGELYTAPLPRFTTTPKIFLNGVEVPAADIAYLGPAPSLVHGVWQANVRIPANAEAGSRMYVQVRFGDVQTQAGVTISVR